MIVPTQLRIARLAADPAVHRAFHWLHLQQPQLRRWHLDIVRIPAPPFGEQARAVWFLDRFNDLGLANPHIDAVGNVLAELPAATPTTQSNNVILVSAHLDTVFPANTTIEPTEQDTRILAPGACDNAAGLSALLGLAAALRHAELAPAIPILFVANVGEEGEGDLRGMRHLFNCNSDGSPYAQRIAAAIALEGSGSSAVVTRALASRRFRVTVTGPGGHAWTDAGAPNPILILARALLALEALPSLGGPAGSPRTTLNIGQIAGGTSINSIPESASASIDLRSTDSAELQSAESALRQSLHHWILNAPPSSLPATRPSHPRNNTPPPALTVETIGDRPGGCLPDDSPLLTTLRAVDRHLNLRTEAGLGSTDANIPLSLCIPAIAIGAGGLGGGIHTLQEWYDPTGRNAALRRILLTLLDTAHLAAAASTHNP